MIYGEAKAIADGLVEMLRPACSRIEIAGSVRRKKQDCGDLEIICIPSPGHPPLEFGSKAIYKTHLDLFLAALEQKRTLTKIKGGDKYKQFTINTDRFGVSHYIPYKLDLFIVTPETWGVQFVIRTGPSDFSRLCVTPKNMGGYLPDGHKVKDGFVWICNDWHSEENLTKHLDMPEEKDFFELLGMGWLEPEKRR